MNKDIKNRKVKTVYRICNVCGRPCRGHECWDCYTSNKYSSLSRQRVQKRSYDKRKDGG